MNSEPSASPEPSFEPERPRASKAPLAALLITTLIGLGGTGYYFLYQKEEMASRRRQEASPLAYFQSRDQATPAESETEEESRSSGFGDLPMPDAPVETDSEDAQAEIPSAEEAPAAESSTSTADTPTPDARLIALEARMARLEQEMEGLSEAMAHLPEQLESPTAQTSALLPQFYRVRQRALDAKPFSDELQALLAMEGLDGETYAALGKLQGAAENGLPSTKTLQKSFARSMQDYLTRARSEAAPGKLWDDMKGRLGSLVQIRKVGAEHAGDDDASLLARAEAATEGGDFDWALKDVSMLSADAAPYFDEWRRDVRRRLRALATFERIERRLLRGA
jgi:uncharacterized coiled-coil protein SlyX